MAGLIIGLVYISALLLPPERSFPEYAVDYLSSSIADAMRISDDGISHIVNAASATELFYNRMAANIAQEAIERLRPNPIAITSSPSATTMANWGQIPRAFVECLDDKILPIALQRYMSTSLPCQKILEIDSDHSPFLSKPHELVKHLDLLSRIL